MLLSLVDKITSVALVILRSDFEQHKLSYEYRASLHVFMNEAAEGNASEAQRLYMERLSGKNLLDRQTFESFHGELSPSISFYVSRYDTGIGRYRRNLTLKETVLLTVVDNNPVTSWRTVRRAA